MRAFISCHCSNTLPLDLSVPRKITTGYRSCELGVPVNIINTSYQKLPFGSADYPDKLLYHQALNQVSNSADRELPRDMFRFKTV